MKRIDVIGQRFGKLVVIADAPHHGRRRCVYCRCDCGVTKIRKIRELRNGDTKSCGCLHVEQLIARNRTHGEAAKDWTKRSTEYRAWQEMKRRCYNKRNKRYADWGGRGIRVCDKWRDNFQAFLTDVGRRPSDCHSLDRIDNDGPYEPANVRWGNLSEQRMNQRRRH